VTRTSSIRRALVGILQYTAIIAVTLLLADAFCILFNLFPPMPQYGDPDLGWLRARLSTIVRVKVCEDNSTGKTFSYERNEDGVRTSLSIKEILADARTKIAVTGDSQSDLCAPNQVNHPGVLERELVASGIPALVLPYPAGRYSPLQDYLAFKKYLRKYDPKILVINLYTGNDFLDMLRPDDRPHFVKAGAGYAIAKPEWYLYDDPSVKPRSRVLFALSEMGKRTGLSGFLMRVQALRSVATEQGEGLREVVAYMNDLRKSAEPSLGYPEAFAAQMLNQQLFFHRFPGAKEESLKEFRALLKLGREENPGRILVVGALPSYELVQGQPIDAALLRVLSRLPVSHEEGVRQEQELYDASRSIVEESGWVFVDNLRALREYRGTARLYNNFDYHFEPVANEIIGRQEALAIGKLMQAGPPSPAR